MQQKFRRGWLPLLTGIVLALGLPLMAAGPQAKKASKPNAAPFSQAQADLGAKGLRPLVVAPSNFAVSRPLRVIAAEEAAQKGPIQTIKLKEVKNQPTPRDEEESFRNEVGASRGGRDGALQAAPPTEAMPALGVSFDAVASADNAAAFGFRVSPPDTNGAVGPNHYVQTVNLLVGIYDKSGALLIPKFKMSSLFASLGAPCGTRDDGDPIVLYDRLADRWFISQFVLPNYPNGPFYQEIAISQTGDPTGAYYIYCFMVHATKMNDYPHFGIWPDGYYMTAHQFNPSYAGQGVWAFDRLKMLAGDPTASFIYFDLNALNPGIGGMLPSDADGFIPPPPGAPNVFAYPIATEWGDPIDGMRLYNFHSDWAVPANSTFTERSESPVAVAAYDPRNPSGRRDVPQPPPATATNNVDSIADRLMFRLQYRNFGGFESLVSCQTVDAAVYPAFQAGVRYCQFKNAAPGGAFSAAEQATFAPDADHRWMGSAACDWQGNLAVGYSVSSTTTFPSIRYAGRLVGDPPNQLTQGEATLIAGSGVQRSTSNRWGDYSSITLDPTDDATFWYTQEYYTAASQATSTVGWLTRVGSFKFSGVPASPRGTLNVTVVDCFTGGAISGAFVKTTDGFVRTTGGGGLASITPVAPAAYTFTASKAGYTTVAGSTGSATVTNGGTGSATVCLLPVAVQANGSTLTAEACVPPNGVIDPNEQVTVAFDLKNVGVSATQNLVATLLASGGVVNPSAPVTVGVISGAGGTGAASFTFAADHALACGSTLTATIHLQDGAYDLGNVTFAFVLGTAVPQGTSNYSSGGVAVPILDNATATSVIAIADPGVVTGLRVKVRLNHTWDGDLTLSLVGPDGTTVTLSAQRGGSGDNYGSGSNDCAGTFTVFDDTAATAISAGAAPFAGSYKPESPLSAFNMKTVTGSWTLRVSDGFAGDTGTLYCWQLDIDRAIYQCCVCPPITITPSPLPPAVVGQPYSQQLTAAGTAGPYTYAVTAGALPTGITLSGTGLLSGTPTSNAAFSFTVTATDAAGCFGSQAFTFSAANLFFFDDMGRSKVCVNTRTGDYIWVIITGPGVGSYSGVATVLNGGAKIVSKPGATNTLNLSYDPLKKKASGYFMTSGKYSALSDANTANNVGGCP